MNKRSKTIFNTSLIYFIILAAFVVVRILTSLNIFGFLGDNTNLILTIIIQVGLLFIFPLYLSAKLNKKTINQTLNDFNFKSVNWQTISISVLIGFIVFILTIALSSFFSFIISLFGYSAATSSVSGISTWSEFIASMLVIAILPAICEEFTHRGMLVFGLRELGIKKVLIYSSLLFGLLHLNIDQFFYATIIGGILGAVAIFSGSIIPAIIIHFINNALGIYLDFAQNSNLLGGNMLTKMNNFLAGGNIFLTILFIILFIFLLIILLFYLIGALLRINAKKSIQDYAKEITLQQMRSEVLGEELKPMHQITLSANPWSSKIKVQIPYEILGFYIIPQIKPNKLDILFLNSSILLGGLITIFTFIWGIL